MNKTASSIRRAAVLAVAIAASAMTLAPAQAQSFQFGIGSDRGGFSFGFGDEDRDDRRFVGLCLTDSQIRRDLRNRGYGNIYLNAPRGRYIQARASKNGWVYLIEYNRCTAEIVDRERLRRS